MIAIFTIGHSTRSIEEFVELLGTYGIQQLVDIRSVPGSRHNPQYSQEALKESLASSGIRYIYMKRLGGWRRGPTDETNAAWRNRSFRSYADYMQTDDFAEGVEELIAAAKEASTAIMCAEAVPWRCHRSLVGDALVVRDVEVRDIISITSSSRHTLTSFANVEGLRITYPGSQG